MRQDGNDYILSSREVEEVADFLQRRRFDVSRADLRYFIYDKEIGEHRTCNSWVGEIIAADEKLVDRDENLLFIFPNHGRRLLTEIEKYRKQQGTVPTNSSTSE